MIKKTIAPSTDNGRGYSGNSSDLARVGLPGTASQRPSEKPAVRESGRTLLSKSFSAVMKIAFQSGAAALDCVDLLQAEPPAKSL
jgi:hypothetical protein